MKYIDVHYRNLIRDARNKLRSMIDQISPYNIELILEISQVLKLKGHKEFKGDLKQVILAGLIEAEKQSNKWHEDVQVKREIVDREEKIINAPFERTKSLYHAHMMRNKNDED